MYAHRERRLRTSRYDANGELIMPTGPSSPVLPPKSSAPPRITSAQLEGIREQERTMAAKKKGYMSTMATRPGGLGILQTQKKKALGE